MALLQSVVQRLCQQVRGRCCGLFALGNSDQENLRFRRNRLHSNHYSYFDSMGLYVPLCLCCLTSFPRPPFTPSYICTNTTATSATAITCNSGALPNNQYYLAVVYAPVGGSPVTLVLTSTAITTSITITSISPATGSIGGGTPLIITGKAWWLGIEGGYT